MMATVPARNLGSVMPAADRGERQTDSLWSLWTDGWTYYAAFRTARSALASLLAQRDIRRLWLPAYACDVLAQASVGVEEIIWYGAGARLQIGIGSFASLRRGDAVLAIDYFGRSPDAAFRQFAASRPDVLWIEDRAQAMAPDGPAWGDVLLYSPRKLIGVADGGLLVSATRLPQPDAAHDPVDEASLWAPEDARSADPDGRAPETWFPLFQQREAAFDIDRRPISRRTLEALSRVDAGTAIRRRQANYYRLLMRLSDFALWPDVWPDFAPLAFPVLIEDRDRVVGLMGARGVFCARHWSDLPCPKDGFPEAWTLSAHILSIPCDQRYDDHDMERAAEALKAVARPARTF
jgi:hypothetical protein